MARGAAARLFVAVDPPPEVCEQLAQWAREASAGWRAWAGGRPRRPPRVLEPEALHLTLCFLGSRPVGEIEALGAALSSCAFGVGELSIGAPLWLPPRRPRVLAVEIHDRDRQLAALQASAQRALAQVSAWEPERRRFRPHITLVRMREGPPGRQGAGPLPPTPRVGFTPEWIALYRSLPGPNGSTYEMLANCGLVPAE